VEREFQCCKRLSAQGPKGFAGGNFRVSERRFTERKMELEKTGRVAGDSGIGKSTWGEGNGGKFVSSGWVTNQKSGLRKM